VRHHSQHVSFAVADSRNIGARPIRIGFVRNLAFFCEEGRKAEVETALAVEQGAEVLDWKIYTQGLVVREIENGIPKTSF